MDWLYQEGASRIYPEYWENFIAPIPEADRGNLLLAYHTILNGTDEAAKLACGRAWAEWETATYRLASDPEEVRVDGEDPYAAVISAIECHYFHHDSWLEEGQIMRDVHKIAHIPCTIVQGRHDTLCPPVTAYRLHKAYPASELRIVIGGHAANEPAICAELVNATDKYRDL
jgi:proline iminopeptidase